MLGVADAAEGNDLGGEDPQSLIRDYVDDTGALINLDGAEVHLDHYAALFDKFEFTRADVIHRISQDAYVFGETRLTATRRDGKGGEIPFHIAEWFATRPHGQLLRMGHGTDLG